MIDADTRTRLLTQYPVLAETSRDTLDVLMASATYMLSLIHI